MPLSRVLLVVVAWVPGWLLGPSTVTAAEPPAGQKWAVLIGIDDYAHANDLVYCGADQLALRDRLLDAGFPKDHVFLLHDKADDAKYRPSRTNLERQLDVVLKLADANDLLVVGFSGHGVQLDGKSYLCPSDGEITSPATLVSLDDLYDRLQECAAAFKLVLVDACRDDPTLGRQRSGKATVGTRALARSLEQVKLPEGMVLLNSCAPGEVSWEEDKFKHGVFMHYLLEALGGAGDANSDGFLSLGELQNYVGPKTKTYVARQFSMTQRPFFRGDLMAEALTTRLLPVPKLGPQPGEVIENSLGMKLVGIPVGEFRMGSNDSDADDDERPIHTVQITKPFWMGQTEVTLGQFLSFYHDGYEGKLDCEQDGKGGWGYDSKTGSFEEKPWFRPWSWGHPDMDIKTTGGKRTAFRHPVVNVSWNDAVAFCRWLSQKEGKMYRLPTEAEWEYACRADTTTRYWTGNDPESLAAVENIADGTAKDQFSWWTTIRGRDGHIFTAPVGSFRANPFGLADMQGNVAEWCSDWYDSSYYEQYDGILAVNPEGPVAGLFRVIRGGGWGCNRVSCRSADRENDAPANRGDDIGFRVVLSLE